MEQKSRISILPPGEAMRIAAGEVVDRPCALVREFLDNAIDALSLNIEVAIEEGGCKKIEVIDDGEGMSKEDLELCTLTHATSKIRCLDDLNTASTLGFRGEALAAAASVSRVEIVTSIDGREAWFLQTGPGDGFPARIEQYRRIKGATVRALDLFESIPARKKFLKREGSEAALCRQVFIDKALAFTKINFRFKQDGKLKDFLPAVSTKKERFAAAMLQAGGADLLHEINVTGAGFSACIVIGGPELYRTDRRQMFIFANGRRVDNYALIQAMDYGTQGWFPNGTHPVGAVFVEIDPALADFNIHPAKREVRFRDPGAIHQAVSGGIKNFFHSYFLRNSQKKSAIFSHGEHGGPGEHGDEFKFLFNNHSYAQHDLIKQNLKSLLDIAHNRKENDEFSNDAQSSVSPCPPCLRENNNRNEPKYAGRVFGLFILIELNDRLFIIDQHAAHERILYNKFLSAPIPKQELLVPIPFTTESDDEDAFLETKQEELSLLGIKIEKDGDSWRIDALPAAWRMGDTETVKEILELRSAGENMAERWVAALCCRAAIKDGDYPDDDTAFALGKEALELPDPRCPHGRPVWTEISREALFKAVRRS